MDNVIIIKAHQNSVIFDKEFVGEKYHYILEQKSTLTYFLKPDSSQKKLHLIFSLAKEAELIFFAIIPDNLESLTIDLDIHESHARAKLRGIYLLQKNQHCSIIINQNHKASNSESDVLFKGILKDYAIVDFQSMTHIKESAPYSNAKTYNKNIILSQGAQAHSKPQLEIENNEVQCSHGSAIGQIDAMQLWYMQARGLSEENAKKLLMYGFLADTLDGVPCDMVSMVQNNLDTVSKNLLSTRQNLALS